MEDDDLANEFKSKSESTKRKAAYTCIGLVHPALYFLKNRYMLYEPAMKIHFYKEMAARSALWLLLAHGTRLFFDFYVMSEYEKRKRIQNSPQHIEQKMIKEGRVSKLRKDNKLNYWLSGRIREE